MKFQFSLPFFELCHSVLHKNVIYLEYIKFSSALVAVSNSQKLRKQNSIPLLVGKQQYMCQLPSLHHQQNKTIVTFTRPKYNCFKSFHMLESSYTFPRLSKTNVIRPSKHIPNLRKTLYFTLKVKGEGEDNSFQNRFMKTFKQ